MMNINLFTKSFKNNDIDTLKLFIKYEDEIFYNYSFSEPILYACKNNLIDVIKTLSLFKKINFYSLNLHYLKVAINHNNNEIFYFLLKNKKVIDNIKKYPYLLTGLIEYCIKHKNDQALSFIINSNLINTNININCLFLYDIEQNNIKLINLLTIENKINLNKNVNILFTKLLINFNLNKIKRLWKIKELQNNLLKENKNTYNKVNILIMESKIKEF